MSNVVVDPFTTAHPDYVVGSHVKSKPALEISVPIPGIVVSNDGVNFEVEWAFSYVTKHNINMQIKHREIIDRNLLEWLETIKYK